MMVVSTRVALFALMIVLCLPQLAPAADLRELRVVAPWAAKGLEPAKSGYIFARMGCLERLVTVDRTGRLVGQLAESWSISPDRLTWTFDIRHGVRFHDGTPLTAEVVADNLKRNRARKGILARVPVTGIRPDGRDKVVITTEIPFAPLPAFLCHYSAVIMAPSALNEQDEIVGIVGTGSYRLVSRKGAKLFSFEMFEDYWGAKPNIPRASYHAVPKADARGFMIQAGQAEMSFTLSPMDALKIERSQGAGAVIMTIPRTRLLKFNCNSPFFSDVRVRRAISLAIDREAIAKTILRNPDSAATQLLPPGVGPWHDPNLASLEHNPVKAGQLLDQAGWKMGSDGTRAKDGRKFHVELVTYSSRPMLPLVAAAVQDQLKRVGLMIDIKIGQSSNIPERHKDGTLQMALLARNFCLIPDPIGNMSGDFGPGGGKWGAMGWESESMSGLLQSYMSSFDGVGTARIRSAILAIIQDQLPVVPISWYENAVGFSDGIENVTIDPLEIDYHLAQVRWAD